MVELVRAGRSPEALAKEYGPSGPSIRNWVRQAEQEEGARADGPSAAEREELKRLRKENRQLREERDILRKANDFLRDGDRSEMTFALIDAEKTRHPVSVLARVLGVSREGYYAWRRRGGQSARTADDQTLTVKITAVHAASRATYGAPRVHADLAAAGVRTSRKRVARLMRQAGLQGVHRRRRVSLTRRDRAAHLPPDLVGRDFTAPAPNRVGTADVTYVPTGQGWLYLAVVLDLYARKIVGWSLSDEQKTPLVADALTMALQHRRPAPGVIHHSDQGGQYLSRDFATLCRQHEVRRSVGSAGDCYDNAVTESFFATLECELLDRTTFATHDQARAAIFDFIEGFYNRQRRHSTNGHLSPHEHEIHFNEYHQAA
ncbi:IS3 family transposase [Frankia sp. AgKG'84/4]|uniref:IS3 family transposase n=1 Tax=Frankia sp. AgKG'84/4 TaxID=573490 RepID=UPI00200D29BD|nr:IS3 family transposase [Frankia sp. AgKG'84/4]MCL9792963.1 IS3 family transposase [Frankia sp. AgKG'84/4]